MSAAEKFLSHLLNQSKGVPALRDRSECVSLCLAHWQGEISPGSDADVRLRAHLADLEAAPLAIGDTRQACSLFAAVLAQLIPNPT